MLAGRYSDLFPQQETEQIITSRVHLFMDPNMKERTLHLAWELPTFTPEHF